MGAAFYFEVKGQLNTMNEQLEVVEGAGAGNTNSPVSPAKTIEGAPDQSQVLLKLQKDLELTRSELKGLQGRQDKETSEVQRFMGEVKKRMSQGMSLEQAEQSITAEQQAAQKDDLLFKIARKVGVLDESPSTPAGNGQPMANDKASTLQQYGLDANDADVAEAIRGKSDPLEIKLAALEVAYKRATKPVADVSASPAVQGRPSPPASVDALTAEYQKEMIAARGNRTAIVETRQKYKKLGVPVDSVVFQ